MGQTFLCVWVRGQGEVGVSYELQEADLQNLHSLTLSPGCLTAILPTQDVTWVDSCRG